VAGGRSPTWRKAPWLLLLFPATALALCAATAVVSLAAASGPTFGSSVENAAVGAELARLGPAERGLEVSVYAQFAPQLWAAADRRVGEGVAGVGRFGAGQLTAHGPVVGVSAGGDGPAARVRLLTRSGFARHLEVLDGGGGRGVWLAASAAGDLGVRAGDEVTVEWGGDRTVVPVAGVYRDLWEDRPLSPFWSDLEEIIVAPQRDELPPPFVLAEPEQVAAIGQALGISGRMTWRHDLTAGALTLGELRTLERRIAALNTRARDRTSPLGAALRDLEHFTPTGRVVSSSLGRVIAEADRTAAALRPPVWWMAIAGQVVGLVVVGAAARFRVVRRRAELTLLDVQGIAPAGQGTRAAVEALPAIAVGAGVGWLAAAWLVRGIGPSAEIGGPAVAQAGRASLVAALAALAVVTVVTAASVPRTATGGAARSRRLSSAPWEAVALAVAGAALYLSRGADPAGAAAIDPLVLLFPVAFVLGLAGLCSRVLARVLPGLGALQPRGAARFLAARRLASASRGVLALTMATSLALGMSMYAALLASSARESVDLKAAVAAGADVVVRVQGTAESVPVVPSSPVSRMRGTLSTAGGEVDVLAVESGTFAAAARWHPRMASQQPTELMAGLQAVGDRPRLLVAGGPIWGPTVLQVGRASLPVDVDTAVRAFPGQAPGRPLLVGDRDVLRAALEAEGQPVPPALTTGTAVWAAGDPATVLPALEAAGLLVAEHTTAEEVRAGTALAAATWTLGYLQALGAAVGVLGLAGVLLYLQARQASRDVGYVLARRMGLHPTQHRRSLAVELAGTLGTAALLGVALALAAAALVYGRVDPAPGLPPAPVLHIPWEPPAALALATALATLAGAHLVQRRADRADPSTVLRLAE
jgi:putative ABC transport system permease protein